MAQIFIKEAGLSILLLMFVLLPIINACLDWLSLGFTRGLLTSICKGHHRMSQALLWAALDLILAMVFLLLISLSLISVIGVTNILTGEIIIDLNVIFTSLANENYKENFWIIFMLLSTLLPTLIHFALVGGVATLWLPRTWRRWLVQDIETDKHKTILAWLYLSITPVVGFFLLPAFMLWGLWSLLTLPIINDTIGTWLLEGAKAYYGLFV